MIPEEILLDETKLREYVETELRKRYQAAWEEYWRERDLDILYGTDRHKTKRPYTIEDIVPYK